LRQKSEGFIKGLAVEKLEYLIQCNGEILTAGVYRLLRYMNVAYEKKGGDSDE
jgi:hypothetical protein